MPEIPIGAGMTYEPNGTGSAYDLLALGDESLMDQPYAVRRERLAAALAHAVPPLHRTPITADPATA